jgi:hypothetical protein
VLNDFYRAPDARERRTFGGAVLASNQREACLKGCVSWLKGLLTS